MPTALAVAVLENVERAGYDRRHTRPALPLADWTNQLTCLWLAMVGGVLIAGTMRIRAAEFATSRRNAHRVAVHTNVTLDGVDGEPLDVSVGGLGVRLPTGLVPVPGMVLLELPGAAPIKLEIARISTDRANSNDSHEFVSLRVAECDWAAFGALALWMFHTPPRAVPGLPAGVLIVGCRLTAPS